jgi:hypothetical protein
MLVKSTWLLIAASWLLVSVAWLANKRSGLGLGLARGSFAGVAAQVGAADRA